MSDKDPTATAVQIIDEQTVVTLRELCRSCAVDAEFVETLVEHGILDPTGSRGPHWSFPASSLRRTRVTIRLQRDLGVNIAGAALALDLLERIDALEARLRRESSQEEG